MKNLVAVGSYARSTSHRNEIIYLSCLTLISIYYRKLHILLKRISYSPSMIETTLGKYLMFFRCITKELILRDEKLKIFFCEKVNKSM